MNIIIFIIGLFVGSAIGYGVFYFRYEDKNTIDTMRRDLNHNISEALRLGAEVKELNEQNRILKDKTSDLLAKNNDLSSIVGELNRYYYYLKEGYAKASELVTLLKGVDPVVEEKIKQIVSSLESGGQSSDKHLTTKKR